MKIKTTEESLEMISKSLSWTNYWRFFTVIALYFILVALTQK